MQSARRDEPFQPDGKRNSRDLEDGHEYQLPCRHGLEDYFEALMQIYDEWLFPYEMQRPRPRIPAGISVLPVIGNGWWNSGNGIAWMYSRRCPTGITCWVF